MQHLPHGGRISRHHQRFSGKLRRKPARTGFIQRQNIADQYVQILFFQFERRGTRIIAECFDHFLQCRHLFDDGFGRTCQDLRILLIQFPVQFPCQTFGRKLDGRERIADFVCQPFGHFAPRRFFLRVYQYGDVVYDHNHTVVVVFRQDRCLTQQDFGIVRSGISHLNRFVRTRCRIDSIKHFGKQGMLHRNAVPTVPVAAPQRHERHTQDMFRSFVEGFQTACFVKYHHTRGQALQHAFEIMPGGFFALPIALVRFLGNGKLLGHMVEQLAQTPELIVAQYRAHLAEIALRDRLRPFSKRQDGLDETTGKIQRHHQSKENRQQRGGKQRRQKESLQTLFAVTQLSIFRPCLFD